MDKRKIYEALKNKHLKDNKKITQQTLSTRLYVIEATIYIDELISETLGMLLDIDWKTSNSLGSKSSAISFNQKVIMMQDMKSVNKQMINKMNCLMQIRNKFAHVSSIDSFEDLFLNSSNGASIRKDLIKWYSTAAENVENENLDYLSLFNELTYDIISFLFEIIGNFFYEIGVEEGKNSFRIQLLDELLNEISKIEGGKDFVKGIMDKIQENKE